MAACAPQGGLEQRARLLEAVWGDVLGERRAVRQGALPARLLPSAGDGRRANPQRYAADLTCCPDAVWRVARDRVGQHPGARLLEAPVLAAFLPCLCRLLLGETLVLASLPTWWMGEKEIWRLLASDSRRFSIRDAFDPESPPVDLAELHAVRRHRLQERVEAEPWSFVAGLSLKTRLSNQRVTYDTEHGAIKVCC